MNTHLALLQDFFAKRGYASPHIPLLQPAEPFLDTAGEDLRRRIFMTSDLAGANLCLRPEFTIPVCLAHLQSGAKQGKYAYGGSVFRQKREGPAEFLQAGMENLGGHQSGSDGILKADVECVTTALDALRHCGLGAMQVVFGDQAIFEALLQALALPEAWRARLGRAFGDAEKFENDLRLIANGDNSNSRGNNKDERNSSQPDPALQQALDENNRPEVERLIVQKMVAASLPASGGRTAEHIAERLMAKAELAATKLSEKQRAILGDFLKIEVPANVAGAKLREFSATHGIELGEAIDIFDERAKLLVENSGDNVEMIWRANFGRRLDYYTGIVFEVLEPGSKQTICGGGRYDNLMNMLGAPGGTPAIGFSIWLDRLPMNLSRSGSAK